MRVVLILGLALAIVAGTAYIIWICRIEERAFNRSAHWKMYSRPVGPDLQGWAVGIERDRYDAPPTVRPLRVWPTEPSETERLDAEGEAILQAVRFNEQHVDG